MPLIYWKNPEVGRMTNNITLYALTIKCSLYAIYYLVVKGKKWNSSF